MQHDRHLSVLRSSVYKARTTTNSGNSQFCHLFVWRRIRGGRTRRSDLNSERLRPPQSPVRPGRAGWAGYL